MNQIIANVKPWKIPRSTLIIIYTPQLDVLLIERADRIGYWQSVTGSQDEGETLAETAVREVGEETGLVARDYTFTDWQQKNIYEIFPIWRHRYAPGVTENVRTRSARSRADQTRAARTFAACLAAV
jgi:dihydroneopterin triphosphate diphosphatase